MGTESVHVQDSGGLFNLQEQHHYGFTIDLLSSISKV